MAAVADVGVDSEAVGVTEDVEVDADEVALEEDAVAAG